jgi:hypothetical protein
MSSVAQVLAAFESDLTAKFLRYSLKGVITDAGWVYLWKSVPDVSLNSDRILAIFSSCVSEGKRRVKNPGEAGQSL